MFPRSWRRLEMRQKRIKSMPTRWLIKKSSIRFVLSPWMRRFLRWMTLLRGRGPRVPLLLMTPKGPIMKTKKKIKTRPYSTRWVPWNEGNEANPSPLVLSVAPSSSLSSLPLKHLFRDQETYEGLFCNVFSFYMYYGHFELLVINDLFNCTYYCLFLYIKSYNYCSLIGWYNLGSFWDELIKYLRNWLKFHFRAFYHFHRLWKRRLLFILGHKLFEKHKQVSAFQDFLYECKDLKYDPRTGAWEIFSL